MSPSPINTQTVAVIGTGRVGTAMAYLLSQRGYDVVAVADRTPEARERAAALSGSRAFESAEEAAALGEIIIITTPDGSIEAVCGSIAGSGVSLSGKKVIHMSGALQLRALVSAAEKGARTLSIHPIQTFADLEGAACALPGSTFGVTCDPELEQWAGEFVDSLDGRVLLVPDDDKVLYHAAAAIACNLLAMVEYGAQVACRHLGFSDEESARAYGPLVVATAENVGRLGPAGALTGPLARGDVGTLKAHLEALEGFDAELADMYRTVSRWGLRLVAEKGDLDESTIDAMRELFD
ncbi:MAG: Rossmann-like and DUF2520 domain-containing protein [Candidatus Geothermincolia bacterium]